MSGPLGFFDKEVNWRNHPTLYFPTNAYNVKKRRIIKTF